MVPMIDLKRMVFRLSQEYSIASFKVYWHVEGVGIFPELGEALDTGKAVIAVSVAVSNNPDIFEALN